MSEPFQSDIVLAGKWDIDTVMRIFAGVLNDHPLLFWVEPALTTTFDGHETCVRFTTNSLYESRADITEKLEAVCGSIRDKLSIGTTDEYSTSLAVHDHLTSTVEYEDTGVMGHCAAGPLLECKGVCEGISEAYNLLMCAIGVKCTKIDGRFLDSDVGHSWNIAYIDGHPYHTDVTSDLSGQHRFLNCSDDIMSLTHRFNRFVSCDSLEANFYHRNGTLFNTVDDSGRYLKEKMRNCGPDVEFLVLEGSSMEHYLDLLRSLSPKGHIEITMSGDCRGFALNSDVKSPVSSGLLKCIFGKQL